MIIYYVFHLLEFTLSIATEHLARILVKKPLREPFLSCCVLLVDQIRILLQNLQESLASAYPDYKPKETDKFDRVIFENLNKMKTNSNRTTSKI